MNVHQSPCVIRIKQEHQAHLTASHASNGVQRYPDSGSNHISNASLSLETSIHPSSSEPVPLAGYPNTQASMQPAQASAQTNPEMNSDTVDAPQNSKITSSFPAAAAAPAPDTSDILKEETNSRIDQMEVDLLLEQAKLNGCSVYIANMTWYTTDSEVLAACSEFGKVVSCGQNHHHVCAVSM
jgi:hypothetical protein